MIRILTPLLILTISLIISIYSYYTYGDFTSYGAAFYPTIIGGILCIFSLIDFFMELNLKKKYIFKKIDIKKDIFSGSLIIITIIFYIIASNFLGFILTTSIILISLTIPFIKNRKVITTIFLIFLSFAIYFLFAKILLVSLPNGIFFE